VTNKEIIRPHRRASSRRTRGAQLDRAVLRVRIVRQPPRARLPGLHRIPDDLGTAVNVQRMVFGNTGPRSATGVAFTRDNVTGAPGEPFGDFLINAQGEDVVAGIRTPRPLVELRDELPEAYAKLVATMELLERTYRNMQDVEFTSRRRLHMLQTPTASAARRRGAHARRMVTRACYRGGPPQLVEPTGPPVQLPSSTGPARRRRSHGVKASRAPGRGDPCTRRQA